MTARSLQMDLFKTIIYQKQLVLACPIRNFFKRQNQQKLRKI